MNYFNEEDKEYMLNFEQDRGDIHKFNYEFITSYINLSENNSFVSEGVMKYKTNSIVEIINSDINNKLTRGDSDFFVIYKVIEYIIKDDFELDIEDMIDKRYFINIIQDKMLRVYNDFLNSSSEQDIDMILKKKISIAQNVIVDLIDIFYVLDDSLTPFLANKKKRSYIGKELYVISDMINHFIMFYGENETNCRLCLISNSCIREIKDSALIEHDLEEYLDSDLYREKCLEKQEKAEKKALEEKAAKELEEVEQIVEIEETKEIEEVEELKENEEEVVFDWISMPDTLQDFITEVDADKYKNVITKKSLPKGNLKLKMKNDNKANIARFLFCFDIPFSRSNSIFGIAITEKDHSKKSYRNDFYRKLKEINPSYEEKANTFSPKK